MRAPVPREAVKSASLGDTSMKDEPFRIITPDKYEIATEVLASTIRILQSVGFSENEIPGLFQQVANRPMRGPLWIERGT
jgi:hypothetical protein